MSPFLSEISLEDLVNISRLSILLGWIAQVDTCCTKDNSSRLISTIIEEKLGAKDGTHNYELQIMILLPVR